MSTTTSCSRAEPPASTSSPAVWLGTVLRPRAVTLARSANELIQRIRQQSIRQSERTRRALVRAIEHAWSRSEPIRGNARSLLRQQPVWGVACLVGGAALAYTSGAADLSNWQRMYLSALVSLIGLLYLLDWRREAGAQRMLHDLREVRWSLSFLHGRLDTKLLKEMQRLSDNVEDLDDRARG